MPSGFYKETEILLRFVSKKNVLFLTHVRPDWDTLASAYALSQFFANTCKTTLGLCENTDARRTAFFAHFSPKTMVVQNLHDFDVVVCVDFRTPEQTGPLAPQFSSFKGKILVLDHHHPSTKEFPAGAQYLLRPSSVATAQMAAQIGRELDVDFSKPVASALAVGMLTDSVRFLLANQETFGVMEFLLKKSGKPYEKLLEMANPVLPSGTRIAVLKSMRDTTLYEIGDYLLAVVNHPHHGALAANALVQLGADIGVGMFNSPQGIFCTVRISTRAHAELKFDAMKALLPFAKQNNGTAGGHAQAAQLNLPAYFSEALLRDFFQRILLEKVRVRDKKAMVRKR